MDNRLHFEAQRVVGRRRGAGAGDSDYSQELDVQSFEEPRGARQSGNKDALVGRTQAAYRKRHKAESL